jgi:hypothetical protein
MRLSLPGTFAAACVLKLFIVAAPVYGETSAPSVHWGALSYPDQYPTLMAGLVVNRFTEFNGGGARFNAVNQTAGYNFLSLTRTTPLAQLPKWMGTGWMGNVSIGAGPTGREPSEYLQNGFIHRLLGINAVPADQRRIDVADFMIGSTITRWFPLADRQVGFGGIGLDLGSLYQELYARVGVRRLSLADLIHQVGASFGPLAALSRYVRVSGMGRYSRIYSGAAYNSSVLANQTWIAQGSVSVGDYRDASRPPRWELEFGAMIDSGLFVTPSGHGIERRFGTIALRFPYGVVETWNDVLGRTDSGPTYGFRLMLDVELLWQRLVNGHAE